MNAGRAFGAQTQYGHQFTQGILPGFDLCLAGARVARLVQHAYQVKQVAHRASAVEIIIHALDEILARQLDLLFQALIVSGWQHVLAQRALADVVLVPEIRTSTQLGLGSRDWLIAAGEATARARVRWAGDRNPVELLDEVAEEERHRPYALGESGLLVYFRDRELSDRVGFVYSSWDPPRAAEDLCGRLLQIRDRLGRKEASACVSIILDGENCWEDYPDSGVGFLSRLYERLATTPGLEGDDGDSDLSLVPEAPVER